MSGRTFRYVLIADGSSDACLRYPIEWLLRMNGLDDYQGEWADLRPLGLQTTTLTERLRATLTHYHADLLFVHRDAEREPLTVRMREIAAAAAEIVPSIPHVPLVPVRMTEAWLLHDSRAIRRAAGKPNGKMTLEIPTSIKQFETLANPKQTLEDALLIASETSGRLRKRKKRDFGRMRMRVAELIDDYAPLRELEAFATLEHDLRAALKSLNH
ncbi:MAG: hypothetical protein KC431_08040 [Myxococcales bacterium]|nr:hypothetical protein [Myxococcales bacterium]